MEIFRELITPILDTTTHSDQSLNDIEGVSLAHDDDDRFFVSFFFFVWCRSFLTVRYHTASCRSCGHARNK